MGKLTDGELQLQVTTFSEFLDQNGYVSAIVVARKDQTEKLKDDETQQCAHIRLNKVGKDALITLLSGMKQLGQQTLADFTKNGGDLSDDNDTDQDDGLPDDMPAEIKDFIRKLTKAG